MESRVRNLDDITLEEKVDFLKREESYPHPTGAVESIETHMSWVFLAGQYAYKLKKPVIYEFIDFSTPEKRLLDCREEVRLNRRLAAEVYLGVVPLTLDPEGSLSLVGEGKPVDWLVKMKRLPRWEMLDEAIRNRSWHPHDLEAVSELLIDFYAKAIPADVTPIEYENRLESDLDSTFRELRGPRSRLSRPALDATEQSLINFLTFRSELLAKRVEEARIVEGHGDLRPEHVCLRNPPSIIDCLEFNRDLRLMDSYEELAFLYMECEFLSDPSPAQIILEQCCRALQDYPPPELFHFYAARRAMVRAKLCIRHLEEPEYREEDKWTRKAIRYLALGQNHAAACYSPDD